MQLFRIFLLTLLGNFAFGQNYIAYNTSIAQAEELLLNNKLIEGVALYKKTFEGYEKCFPNDTYVAAQAACLLKDFTNAAYFFQKGIKYGLNELVFQEPIFTEFLNSNQFNMLQKDYDSLRSIYKARINYKYREEVYKLRRRDRLSNPTHSFLAKIGLRRGDSRVWVMDSCEVYCDSLMSLYQEYGEPSISTIGSFDKSILNAGDSTLYQNGVSPNLGWFLLWHYPYAFQEWEEVLYEALSNGDIPAYYYAVCRDFSSRWYTVGGLSKKAKNKIEYKDPFYFVLWTTVIPENTTQINDRRAKIGLSSLEVEKKKQAAQNHYNYCLQQKDQINLSKTINYNYYLL